MNGSFGFDIFKLSSLEINSVGKAYDAALKIVYKFKVHTYWMPFFVNAVSHYL